jgi:stage V sporulation protein B
MDKKNNEILEKKTTFLKGAVILAAAGAIIKALGAVFRIPLGNLISDEGMGYYQTAYTIYVMFLVVSNSGVPVAISRMVSERTALNDNNGAHRIFRVSFILMLFIGTISFLVCFLGTDLLLSGFPNMGGAALSVKAIAPALLIVPIMASFRGYFQGMQNMQPTANSQVTEQLFRVLAGLSSAYLLLPFGRTHAAAGAAFGASVGALAGLLTVFIIYLIYRQRVNNGTDSTQSNSFPGLTQGDTKGISHQHGDETSNGFFGNQNKEAVSSILLKIFFSVVPITIGAAIMPIMNFIDLTLITNRLSTFGWIAEDITKVYGRFTGFANPLINLPQIMTQAVAMSLVPAAAAAFKRNDMEFLRHNIRLGLRTSIILGLPCAFGMMVLSKEILLLLYPKESEAAIGAAGFLFILAFGIIFLAAVQTLTGILQGVGKQMIPVRNLFIGAIVKICITWVLLGVPTIRVRGAAIGTVSAYLTASALNLYSVIKYTGTSFNISLTFLKPLLSGLTMGASVWLIYKGLNIGISQVSSKNLFTNVLPTIVSIVAGATIYILMIFASGAISKQEVKELPVGNRIKRILGV